MFWVSRSFDFSIKDHQGASLSNTSSPSWLSTSHLRGDKLTLVFCYLYIYRWLYYPLLPCWGSLNRKFGTMEYHTLPKTKSETPWKWMVGFNEFPFGANGVRLLLVSGWLGFGTLLTWRIIPVRKWFITTVNKSPKDQVVPLPHGLFMAYKLKVIRSPRIQVQRMILQAPGKVFKQSRSRTAQWSAFPWVPPESLGNSGKVWKKKIFRMGFFGLKLKNGYKKDGGAQLVFYGFIWDVVFLMC